MTRMDLEYAIKRGEHIRDIPHFYECAGCGFKHNRQIVVIEHQLNECEQIGYFEE